LRRRGYLYATTGRIGFAKIDLNALIALDPNDRDAHFFKGLADFVGAPRLAVPSFTRAIEINPGDLEARSARAWAYLVDGYNKEAIADFSEVLRRSPGDTEALRGRAWGLVQTGNYQDGIIRLASDNVEAYFRRALLVRLGHQQGFAGAGGSGCREGVGTGAE
jgi:tetratricopeptide (TPR) repeat protein